MSLREPELDKNRLAVNGDKPLEFKINCCFLKEESSVSRVYLPESVFLKSSLKVDFGKKMRHK